MRASLEMDIYSCSHLTKILDSHNLIRGSTRLQHMSSSQQDLIIHFINTATASYEIAMIVSTKDTKANKFKC